MCHYSRCLIKFVYTKLKDKVKYKVKNFNFLTDRPLNKENGLFSKEYGQPSQSEKG